MDVHGASLETGMALRLVTVIGCTISSIALLAALIVFQCFKNMKVCYFLKVLFYTFGSGRTPHQSPLAQVIEILIR